MRLVRPSSPGHTRRQPESQAKRYLPLVSRLLETRFHRLPSYILSTYSTFSTFSHLMATHDKVSMNTVYGNITAEEKTHAFTITICHLFRRFAKPLYHSVPVVPHSRLGPCWQYLSRTVLPFSFFPIRFTPLSTLVVVFLARS